MVETSNVNYLVYVYVGEGGWGSCGRLSVRKNEKWKLAGETFEVV